MLVAPSTHVGTYKPKCLHEHRAASQWGSIILRWHPRIQHDYLLPYVLVSLTQKLRFSDKTIVYSEKKPPNPLCSKVIASQHKSGKVQLIEWKKDDIFGNKLVSLTINERQLKPVECGNHKHPGTYFPIHIIQSDKLKVIFCIILPPPIQCSHFP